MSWWGGKRMLEAGTAAPEFELQRLDGGPERLYELSKSGPVLLVFFKVSCPVCQMTLPFLDRIHRGQPDPGLKVFGISQDDVRATRRFNREFDITFPVLLDGAGYPASNAFGISHVPTIFLVERDGAVAWTLDGFDKRELEGLGRKFGVVPFRPDDRVPEQRPG
jgi:peroxiredoxin